MALLETDPVTLKRTADGLLDVVAMASAAPCDSGLAAVVTGVRARLALIRGEWFLNLDAGVPWYERDGVNGEVAILGSKFSDVVIRTPVLQAILATPGVTEVTQLRIVYNPSTRAVSITWAARCLFGETPPDTLVLGA